MRPLLAVLLFFMLLASCKNDIETINLVTAESLAPNMTDKDVEIIFSDSAKMKIKLMSPLLQHYVKDTSYMVFPQGIHVLFYDDSLKVKTELTSKYAIRYDGLGRMEARNDVVLTNIKGEKLNTERLIWDENKKLIYTDAFVKIATADEIIFGDGLESNQDFSKYRIIKPTGTLVVPADEKNKK